MRTRIWIPLIIVLAVCLLLLFKTKQHQRSALPEQGEAPTNQPSQPEPPKAAENQPVSNIPQPPALPPTATTLAQALATTNPVAAMRLALWQAPIEFYGIVVDENSNAVAGAKVGFHWVEIPNEEGNRATNTESDAEGLFSLHGARGPDLMVSVGKEGYYVPHGGQWGFHYAFGDKLSPDPRNPVVFNLRKKGKGAELITSENDIRPNLAIRIPKDGTPVRVDFFQKQASPTGQLEISQNKPPLKDATNWSFRMTISDGGFVENEDEFQFEAPETNYKPTVEYHFTKSETNWPTQFVGKYYIAFGQPRKYGWFRIESNLAQETIFLTYAINPTGSQNLEPQ